MSYSRITKIRVINFESHTDSTAEFDERGILLFKGYNDSGKSAFLNALRVCFYNWNPRKQQSYIHDDCDSFNILVYFDDGVIIRRDKYQSGSSAYIMYKNGSMSEENIIFTTVKNGVMSQFEEVPEPIQKYLGVAKFDKMYLNMRDREDAMLLVHTSGSDNYKFLNHVLHSDELELAARLLNVDKNKQQTLVNEEAARIKVLNSDIASMYHITDKLVETIEALDKVVTDYETQMELLKSLKENIEAYKLVVIPPKMEVIDTNKLATISELVECIRSYNFDVRPVLNGINSNRLELITKMVTCSESLNDIVVRPSIKGFDEERIRAIENSLVLLNALKECNNNLANIEKENEANRKGIEDIHKVFEENHIKVTKCDNCGNVVSLEV